MTSVFSPILAALQAVKDVLDIQESLGIDVVTDGEMARETYYLHLCRNLSGVDFENTVDKVMREGKKRSG
jgi:methionine synthase II (cobalamin-independent)